MRTEYESKDIVGESGTLSRDIAIRRSSTDEAPDQFAEHVSLRRLGWVAPLTLVVAVIANEILYAIAARLNPRIGKWPLAGPSQIFLSTLAYLVIGAIVFVLVVRLSSHPVRTYWTVATIALMVSLALPLSVGAGLMPPGMPVPDATTVATLGAMHVVAYLITVTLFTRLTRAKAQVMM